MFYTQFVLCNVDIMMSYLLYGQYVETASPCQEDDYQFWKVPSIQRIYPYIIYTSTYELKYKHFHQLVLKIESIHYRKPYFPP